VGRCITLALLPGTDRYGSHIASFRRHRGGRYEIYLCRGGDASNPSGLGVDSHHHADADLEPGDRLLPALRRAQPWPGDVRRGPSFFQTLSYDCSLRSAFCAHWESSSRPVGGRFLRMCLVRWRGEPSSLWTNPDHAGTYHRESVPKFTGMLANGSGNGHHFRCW
jgi:hypothetical protein